VHAESTAERLIDFRSARFAPADGGKHRGTRRVCFDRHSGWVETQVVARHQFTGAREGPVIIESDDSTAIVPPGAVVSVGEFGNLAVDLSRGAPQ
jgi:N-methylhydantoinase A